MFYSELEATSHSSTRPENYHDLPLQSFGGEGRTTGTAVEAGCVRLRYLNAVLLGRNSVNSSLGDMTTGDFTQR